MSAVLTDAERRLAHRSFGNAMRLAIAGRYFDAMRSAHAVKKIHPESGAECIELVEAFCGPT